MQNKDAILAKIATDWAAASKDRSTKVGALVIGPDDEPRSAGYNGFPRGVNDDVDERHERPAKYLWTIHAERNAIDNAARVGTALKGCSIYVPDLFPCPQCAGSIINAGIVEVITCAPDFDRPTYGDQFRVSVKMFEEAGVKVRILPDREPTRGDVFLEAVRRHIRSYEPGTLVGSELNIALQLCDIDGPIWDPWCVPGSLKDSPEQ